MSLCNGDSSDRFASQMLGTYSACPNPVLIVACTNTIDTKLHPSMSANRASVMDAVTRTSRAFRIKSAVLDGTAQPSNHRPGSALLSQMHVSQVQPDSAGLA